MMFRCGIGSGASSLMSARASVGPVGCGQADTAEPLDERHGALAGVDLVCGKGGDLPAIGADEAELAAALVEECGDAHGDRLLAVWRPEGGDASFGAGETGRRARTGGVSRFGLQVDGPYPPEECVSNSPHSQSPACMLRRLTKGEKCRKTAECRSNSTSLL